MTKIIDISRKIYTNMPNWPTDRDVIINSDSKMSEGNVCNVSSIGFNLHSGTHIDAPYHFFETGDTIESLDLSKFIGHVKIFELNVKNKISCDDIYKLPFGDQDIVFLKTSNSLINDEQGFFEKYIYIDDDAAALLVERQIKTIGIDYLSVDKFDSETYEVHKLLLSNNIGIVEGLQLRDVKPGIYFFSCLPLNVVGVDGAPARAVLIDFDQIKNT